MYRRHIIIDGLEVAVTGDLRSVYEPRFRAYGPTPSSLLYPDNSPVHGAKMRNYRTILSQMLVVKPQLRILDVGCGYGSLAAFIPAENYLGIDVVGAFIACARKQFPGHDFREVSVENFTDTTDVAVLAGVMGSVPRPLELLRRAYARSNHGVLVDFNDQAHMPAGWHNPDCPTYEIDEVEEALRRHFTPDFKRYDGDMWKVYYLPKPS